MKKLEFRVSISDKNIHKDDMVHVGFLFDNKSICTSLDIKVDLDISNSFYKTEAPLCVNVASTMRSLSKTIVPLEATLCGIINVCVKKVEVRDLIGIVSYVYEVDKNVEVDVFPSNGQEDDIDKTGLYEGVSENEEANSKGNDLSDVSNIREYVPGDRIKDIHWKASAKKDILMVKERVRISERQLIMLVDTSGTKQDIDNVLQYAYTIVKMCLVDGIPTRLVWWNSSERELNNSQIMSFEDLKTAYVDLYRCGECKDISEAKNRMKYAFTNVASFVHICCDNGVTKGVPVDNV